MALWAAEEIDEDLQDVDLTLAIGNYGQNGMYDDGALLYLIFFCAIP
jgi:translation initiation factor 3 subunit L